MQKYKLAWAVTKASRGSTAWSLRFIPESSGSGELVLTSVSPHLHLYHLQRHEPVQFLQVHILQSYILNATLGYVRISTSGGPVAAGFCKAPAGAMATQAGKSCSLCQAQLLCRTEPAAPAGSESATGTFRGHNIKGSTGHGALGGAVLCRQQRLLRGEKGMCTMNDCHSK